MTKATVKHMTAPLVVMPEAKAVETKITICVVCGKGHPKPLSWPVSYPSLCKECNK